MPLPLLIPLATTAASAAISYFSSSSQYEQQKAEAERRRQALEDAKITASEKREGIQNITRTSQNTAAESMNRYAFANRGVQSNQAKGAFMGQLNAGMLNSINQYEQSTLNYNKNIDRNIAGVSNPINNALADTASGGLAGLHAGMTLMDMYGDDFANLDIDTNSLTSKNIPNAVDGIDPATVNTNAYFANKQQSQMQLADTSDIGYISPYESSSDFDAAVETGRKIDEVDEVVSSPVGDIDQWYMPKVSNPNLVEEVNSSPITDQFIPNIYNPFGANHSIKKTKTGVGDLVNAVGNYFDLTGKGYN